MIEKSIEHLDTEQYFPMKHSKIFLSISDYLEIENKLAIKNKNEKEKKKNKNFNKNQTSFYFEDYLETSKKNNYFQKNNLFLDRIYLLFFLFFSLIFIFSIRIIHVSLNEIEIFNQDKQKLSLLRRDIVDRNGTLISRNIKSFHAAINPKLINNKETFLIKLRLAFPELPIKRIEKKLDENKYFYLKTFKSS